MFQYIISRLLIMLRSKLCKTFNWVPLPYASCISKLGTMALGATYKMPCNWGWGRSTLNAGELGAMVAITLQNMKHKVLLPLSRKQKYPCAGNLLKFSLLVQWTISLA